MSRLTVYSTPGCVQCNATYKKLDQRGIPYDVVDVSKDEDAAARVKALGYTQAPVVVLGCGRHWSGYRPDLLNELKVPNDDPEAA